MLEAKHLLHPRLRPVEAFPVRMDGQDLVCLQDPQNLAEEPIYLDRFLLFLISRMDGKHSLRDIQADFLRETGEILPMENIESLVTQLDDHLYLNGPTFRGFYRALVEQFRASPSRPACHAGASYPKDADALRSQIRGYFDSLEGPGDDPQPVTAEPLRGLIAPHIDFTRGGPVYAHAYNALSCAPIADTFIIFGTCHTPMPRRFSISGKDYETPMGPAVTDKDFAFRLSARLNGEYADDFPHRGEHSIEFQAVFLKYMLETRQDFKIVPILVNSFHDIYARGRTAAEDPEIRRVVDALRETMGETKGRICVIAGADLAHVGRRFGDPSGPTARSLREVEQRDLDFLKLVEGGDAEGVFQSVAADNDSRRICGYPPIYMSLRCIDKPMGKLIRYRQWSDTEAGAAVTFAAVRIF